MRSVLNEVIDKLQETFPANRVVVLLTPAFVAVSGWLSTWAAQHLPGIPQLNSDWLTGVFVAGALSAATAAYKWIDGWQKYENAE